MRMVRSRPRAVGIIGLVAVVAFVVAACATGGPDQSAIRARVDSIVQNFNSGNPQGLLSDLVPADRAGCDPAKIAAAFSDVAKRSSDKARLAVTEIKVQSVENGKADVEITSVLQGVPGGDTSPNTAAATFKKVDGQWYLSLGGPGCAGFGTPTPTPTATPAATATSSS